jgi:hypothetical protein
MIAGPVAGAVAALGLGVLALLNAALIKYLLSCLVGLASGRDILQLIPHKLGFHTVWVVWFQGPAHYDFWGYKPSFNSGTSKIHHFYRHTKSNTGDQVTLALADKELVRDTISRWEPGHLRCFGFLTGFSRELPDI